MQNSIDELGLNEDVNLEYQCHFQFFDVCVFEAVHVLVCGQLKEMKVLKLQQGCFPQNSAPEGTRAITHNSPALIGCIQLLYWKLSSFCRPQVPITLHLPFSF